MKKLYSVLLLVLIFSSLSAYADSLAEKLGFEKDARLLIIHADDLGLSHSVNRASFEAMNAKIVTSGGVLIPAAQISEVIEYYQTHSEADVGVHLDFTSEWAVSPVKPITDLNLSHSLVNAAGNFWASAVEVAQNASLEQIETEIQAQIDKVFSLGLQPSHLDTHSGVMYTRPDFLQAYLNAARKNKLVPLMLRLSPENEAMAKAIGLPFDDLKPVWEQAESDGLALLDTLYLDEQTVGAEQRKNAYVEFLKNLKPGLSEILLDLAYEDEEMKALIASKEANAEDISAMLSDREFFTDPATLKLIQDLNIHLVNWRDVQKVLFN